MISIIIPVYNNEKYIDRCIESILLQTYSDFELLLMVGRCRDKSLEKCIEWQEKDDRIIIVSRKDHSTGDAKNYALPMARGEYVAYIDSDDWVTPNYLERLVLPLEADASIDLSVCGYTQYDGNRKASELLPHGKGIYDVDFASFLSLSSVYAHWSRMYRRRWLIDNGITMYDGQCEDFGMYLMVAAIAKRIYIVRESLYCYNISNPNSLSKVPIKSYTDYARAFDFTMPFLRKYGIDKKYREDLIRFSCKKLQNDIYNTNFEPEIVKTAKWFINKTFPELSKYMEYEPKKIAEFPKEAIIFGSGKDAMRLIYQMPKGIHVKYMVDNNKAKTGQSIEDMKIKDFDSLLQERRDISIIVASRRYQIEIAKQLNEAGFKKWFYIRDILTKDELAIDIKELTD